MSLGSGLRSLLRPAASRLLPPRPPKELDPYLDAAARCFARHGIRRTTVPDIVREVGRSRTTVYRQIGSVAHAARLLMARETHRLLDLLPHASATADGPSSITGLIDAVVRFTFEHPVAAKVLSDERDLIGTYFSTALPDVIAQVSATGAPLLEDMMNRGLIARRDPEVLADFLVRTTVSVIAAPPPGDVSRYLEATLLPILETGDRRHE